MFIFTFYMLCFFYPVIIWHHILLNDITLRFTYCQTWYIFLQTVKTIWHETMTPPPPMEFVTYLGDDWQFDPGPLTWPVFCDFYLPGGLWSLLGLRSHRCRFLDMWTLREERAQTFCVAGSHICGHARQGQFWFFPKLELIIGCFLPIPFFPSLPSFFFQRCFPCHLVQHPSKPSWHPQSVCTQWYTHQCEWYITFSPAITGQLYVWNSGSFGGVLSEGAAVLRVESLEKRILLLWITFPKYQKFRLNNCDTLNAVYSLFWRLNH